MQNTDSSHDGGAESCGDSESSQGQTGKGTAQSGMPPPQGPEMAFTGQAGTGTAGGDAGSQHAYDIPRYTSEGHLLGRPQEENNPQSAGNIQGSGQVPHPGGFQDAGSSAYQQVPPQQVPNQQAPNQMHPQGMYNQVPPQQAPNQMQPQNVYQQNPAQTFYQQNPYSAQYAPPYTYQQTPPPPEEPSAGEKRHGRIMDVVNGIINGEDPDIPKLIGILENMDTRFWKGAMIGAGLMLLVNSETVKKTIGDALSGIMGKSSKTEKGENNV